MRGVFRSMRLPLLLSLAIVVSVCSCERKEKQRTEDVRSWAEETFTRLSEEQKVGQLLCLTIDPVGYYLNPAYKGRIQSLVRKYQPGAVFFLTDTGRYTRENLEEFNGVKLRSVALELQSYCEVPLLVAAECESGVWLWDHTATQFPAPMALGAAWSPILAFREGKIIAHEAVAQGVNWLFAPAASLTAECGSAHFSLRCFGSEPDSVAEFVAQFVKGTQDSGAAVCLTSTGGDDGRGDPPGRPYSKPVASGVSAGAHSIMANLIKTPESHAPQAEPSSHPKTVLTERYGFTGLVVRRLSEKSVWTPDEEGMHAFIGSFEKGQDMLIFPDDTDRIEPYVDFLFTGLRLKKADVGAAPPPVRKILALKEKLNLHRRGRNQGQTIAGLGIREYRQTAQDIAKASLTLLRNDRGLIPLDTRGSFILFVNISDSSSTVEATTFSGDLEKTHPELKQINIFGKTDSRLVIEVLRRAGEASAVVCTLFLKPAPDSHTPGLSNDNLSLIRRVVMVNRNCVCISFAGPCLFSVLPEAGAFLAAYSLTPVDTDAAIKAVFGECGVSGRLPFALSSRYPVGFGLRLPGPASR